ncbi:MFS transporter [Brockia lithotrophica]|uniref:Putative MFS family arabinose efflux permease n=1 Tax=Brockia lithotrophica TaxID=933949 RepID=A0A660KUQ7_9BACL|nr:MFS transporter [Brockia lithotrophica]RKQ83645.1 putative MFS family arabinose efflux permease [Brockia lithotrophica]
MNGSDKAARGVPTPPFSSASPRMGPSEEPQFDSHPWRKNLVVLTISLFFVAVGFSQLIPFLPLFLASDLGLRNSPHLHFWSGAIYSVSFFSSFLMAPVWGALADRMGRKLMVLRSGFGMAVTNTLMAFVHTPGELFVLRFLNGFISGIVPASVSLMAVSAPRERVGWALGVLQSGSVAGTIVGPALGGLLAEHFGYRTLFLLTGASLFAVSLLALFGVSDVRTPPPPAREKGGRAGSILLRPDLVVLFLTNFLVQFAFVAIYPLLSLFVAELVGSDFGASFWAGVVMGLTALANMVAAPVLGRATDRLGARRVLVGSLVLAAMALFPHAFVRGVASLLALRVVLGVALGGISPSLNAVLRLRAPEGFESRTFGYATSAANLGNFLGPLFGGAVADVSSLRTVFPLSAALLLANAFVLEKLYPRLEEGQGKGLSQRGDGSGGENPPPS